MAGITFVLSPVMCRDAKRVTTVPPLLNRFKHLSHTQMAFWATRCFFSNSCPFSSDNVPLVNAVPFLCDGWLKVIVWDVALLCTARAGTVHGAGSGLAVVARQISDFPITKMLFSPFEKLVRCNK